MPRHTILVAISQPEIAHALVENVLKPQGYNVHSADTLDQAQQMYSSIYPDLLLLDASLFGDDFYLWIDRALTVDPSLSVVLFSLEFSSELALRALYHNFRGYLFAPLRREQVLHTIQNALQVGNNLDQWALTQSRRSTQVLRQRVADMETLSRVGRSVTAVLELDTILTTAVDAALQLTGAESGSVLLQEEETGDLYIRAARNLGEELVRTLRLPVQSSPAGEVMRSGKPLLLNPETPHKIKTAYLVNALIYVPLIIHGQTIGVLGVENQRRHDGFSEEQVAILSTVADFVAIAIENARLYKRADQERKKYETILMHVENGVIVIDVARQVVFLNRAARRLFNLGDQYLAGRSIFDIIHNPELVQIFNLLPKDFPYQTEIKLPNGPVFDVHAVFVVGLGIAITLQDITYLKEMDRIKSEFVSTVSHDLRSPLTAVMGYVELLGRVGPLTEQQKEFIRRVQVSVQNITALINELLDLGRIEAGLDTQMELVSPMLMLEDLMQEWRPQVEAKKQTLKLEAPPEIPVLLASPTRLRQMLNNLINNAVKYTPEGGIIRIVVAVQNNQLILQVIDNGPGIPHADQPYIFDKFYRASNAANKPGTGLGLAIVRSIVEGHQGRVWVESTPGEGATFTVVLPINTKEIPRAGQLTLQEKA